MDIQGTRRDKQLDRTICCVTVEAVRTPLATTRSSAPHIHGVTSSGEFVASGLAETYISLQVGAVNYNAKNP